VLVLVKDGANFAHICEPVVIFGAKGEFTEIAKRRYANGVKVPAPL